MGLSQRPVQMHVAAIDNQVLAGGVAGLRGREQKHRRRRDLRRQRHPMSERYLVGDFLELCFRIAEGLEPAAVKRSHDFCGKHCVDADVVRKQFRGPFASERKLRTFGRGISGCSALLISAREAAFSCNRCANWLAVIALENFGEAREPLAVELEHAVRGVGRDVAGNLELVLNSRLASSRSLPSSPPVPLRLEINTDGLS